MVTGKLSLLKLGVCVSIIFSLSIQPALSASNNNVTVNTSVLETLSELHQLSSTLKDVDTGNKPVTEVAKAPKVIKTQKLANKTSVPADKIIKEAAKSRNTPSNSSKKTSITDVLKRNKDKRKAQKSKPKQSVSKKAPKPVAKKISSKTNKAKVKAAKVAKLAAENKAKVKAAKVAKLAAENKAKVKAAKVAKLAAENKAKAKAAKVAKLAAENKAKAKAAKVAKLVAENKAKAKSAKVAKLAAENKAKVEAVSKETAKVDVEEHEESIWNALFGSSDEEKSSPKLPEVTKVKEQSKQVAKKKAVVKKEVVKVDNSKPVNLAKDLVKNVTKDTMQLPVKSAELAAQSQLAEQKNAKKVAQLKQLLSGNRPKSEQNSAVITKKEKPSKITKKPVELKKLNIGKVSKDKSIILSVIFKDNETVLTDLGRKKLSKIISNVMKKNNGKKLRIIGYASSGNKAKGVAARRISFQRAISVRNFMINSGLSSKKISVKAMGKGDSKGVNNDRVDIIFLNNGAA